MISAANQATAIRRELETGNRAKALELIFQADGFAKDPQYVKPRWPDPKPAMREIWPAVSRSLRQVNPGVRAAMQKAMGNDIMTVLLSGGVGTGKTSTMLAISDLIRRSKYYTLEESVDAMMNPRSNFFEDVAETPLLLIDELGARDNLPDIHVTTALRISDLRVRAGRPTIYATNLEPFALAHVFDRRVFSRICSGIVIDCDGDREIAIDVEGDRRFSK